MRVDRPLYEGISWIHLAQDTDLWRAALYTEKNFRVSWKALNYFTSWVTVKLSRRTLFVATHWVEVGPNTRVTL
jgi:hypothetical protein